jgi:hypothetical protein
MFGGGPRATDQKTAATKVATPVKLENRVVVPATGHVPRRLLHSSNEGEFKQNLYGYFTVIAGNCMIYRQVV